MKRRAILIALVALTFVFGCTKAAPKSTGALTGTQGLILSFLQNSPPDRIFSGTDLKMGVKLENQGGSDITAGNIYISGFDRTIVPLDKTIDGINLGGRNIYNPVGGIEIKEFNAKISAPQSIDKIPQTFLVTACYDYATTASAAVCMDFNPFSTETAGGKACTPQDVSLSGGQAAPIAITKVGVMPAPDVTRFAIDIENLGGGLVYKKGSQFCDPYSQGLTFNEIDYVKLDSVVISQEDITGSCQPVKDGFVKLTNKKVTIYCSKFVGGGEQVNGKSIPAFNAPLKITISYGYRNSVSKTIEIARPPQ